MIEEQRFEEVMYDVDVECSRTGFLLKDFFVMTAHDIWAAWHDPALVALCSCSAPGGVIRAHVARIISAKPSESLLG